MKKLIWGSVLAMILWACKSDRELPADIGLQLYSLRKQFEKDVPGTLEMIGKWGVESIEGGETYGMDQDEFIKLLKANNLNVVSIGADYNGLASSPEAIIAKAKSFGATYVMCPWIPHEGDEFTLENTRQAIEVFNKAGEMLKAEDLQLVYHPHGYEFRPYREGTLMDLMLEEAEHFGFEMDVYWFTHGGADPLAYLKTHPDKFKLLHLKDMEHGVKGNDSGHEDVETNVELGTGQIDIAAIVIRAREMGIKYMFIEDESSRVVEQIPQSLSFLKTFQ